MSSANGSESMVEDKASKKPSPFDSFFYDPFLTNEWLAVCPSSDVSEGNVKEAMVMAEPLVLWRAEGNVHAWRDLCIHRGSKLSLGSVRDGCLVCPYHAWTYNEEGKCVRVPAHPDIEIPDRARTVTYQAQDHLDLIWVCLGKPRCDPPPAIWWRREGFKTIPAGPYEFDAMGTRAIENFADVAHLCIVHDGILGTSKRPEIENYAVKMTEEGIFVPGVKVFQPSKYGEGEGTYALYDYHIFRPLTIQFKSSVPEGTDAPLLSSWFTVSPVDRTRSVGWIWIMHNIEGVPDAEMVTLQDTILAQDLAVVNTQHPELVPLDLSEELHLASDRTAVEYRKWLRQLGMQYGTY